MVFGPPAGEIQVQIGHAQKIGPACEHLWRCLHVQCRGAAQDGISRRQPGVGIADPGIHQGQGMAGAGHADVVGAALDLQLPATGLPATVGDEAVVEFHALGGVDGG